MRRKSSPPWKRGCSHEKPMRTLLASWSQPPSVPRDRDAARATGRALAPEGVRPTIEVGAGIVLGSRGHRHDRRGGPGAHPTRGVCARSQAVAPRRFITGGELMKPGKKTVHELDIDNCLADLRHDLGQATAVLNASAYVKDTTDVRTLVMMGNAAVAH